MHDIPSRQPVADPDAWRDSARPTREWCIEVRSSLPTGDEDEALLESLTAAGCKGRTFSPGSSLIEAGRTDSSLFVIVAGEVQVRLGGAAGHPLRTVRRGGIVGEMAAVDDSCACASVVAVQATTALEVPRSAFWPLVERSHLFARRLLMTLARRLRTNNEVVADGMREQQQLLHAANRDELTGLRNRRWLDAQLEVWAIERRSGPRPLAFGLLDIDHFKRFNDVFGHQAGDTVLKAFGQALEGCLRATDAVVRWGGEEFAVVMPGAPLQPAERALRRMCQAVARLRCESPQGERLPQITFSAGLVAVDSFDCSRLVATADELLYEAKRGGRNRIVGSAALRP